MKSIFNF